MSLYQKVPSVVEAVVLLAVAEALPELDGRPEGVGLRGALPVHPATLADLAACLHTMGDKKIAQWV